MKYRRHNQTGYTLVELLLYIAIVGSLLTAIVFFLGTTVESRLKNETISEVNDQGASIMDTLTQTIRNATSITSPASGASLPALTLVVPTGTLSPTVFDLSGTLFGLNLDGGTSDTSDHDAMNATKIVAGATGTISSLNAYVATVAASPNNQAQMALYSGTTPTTLLATSSSVTLKANTWNNFPIPTTPVTSGQTYWIAYNTNGLATGDNDLRERSGSAGQSGFLAQTFGTWPNSWTPTTQSTEFSMYAMIDPANTPGAIRIKEGSGSVVPLTDSNVQLSGLNFRNLTRTGAPGVIQITFTLSRLNPLGRNEYDYQKTFTASAEVGW